MLIQQSFLLAIFILTTFTALELHGLANNVIYSYTLVFLALSVKWN